MKLTDKIGKKTRLQEIDDACFCLLINNMITPGEDKKIRTRLSNRCKKEGLKLTWQNPLKK